MQEKTMKADRLKKLNPRQKKFCLLRASGMSQIDAYHKAGFKGDYQDSCKFEKREEVQKEIRRLQDSMEEKLFDLRSACAKLAPDAIKELQNLLSDPMSFARLGAISQLLDRAYGKPKEVVEEKVTVVWDM